MLGSRRNQRRVAADSVSQARIEVDSSRLAHGEEAPETLKALADLAAAYFRAQDYVTAKATADTVYSIRETLIGEERALPSLTVSARCLYESGDYENARDLQVRILQATAAQLGSDSTWTAQAMVNLAVTLSRMGDDERARTLQRQAIEIYERALGPDDPQTEWARDKIAITEVSVMFPWLRMVAFGVVVLAVGLLIGFGESALGIGLGLSGGLLAEGFRGMRQDRRIDPRPTAVNKVRAFLAVLFCVGGGTALLVVETHNVIAQGVAGSLLGSGFIGIVMNTVGWRSLARRRRQTIR